VVVVRVRNAASSSGNAAMRDERSPPGCAVSQPLRRLSMRPMRPMRRPSWLSRADRTIRPGV
jgi:hypothetical protein